LVGDVMGKLRGRRRERGVRGVFHAQTEKSLDWEKKGERVRGEEGGTLYSNKSKAHKRVSELDGGGEKADPPHWECGGTRV